MKTNQLQNNNQKIEEEFFFEIISDVIERGLNRTTGVIIQKGIFPTNLRRGIKVYVHSGDHLPIHFHVKSEQRYLDAKIQIEPLELIENKTVVKIEKDINYIMKFFRENSNLLKQINNKFIELNPNLKYGN